MSQVDDILSKLGVRSDSLDRIRLARGVVGKTSYVMALAIGALGLIGYKLDSAEWLMALACLIVALMVFYILKILNFAQNNPSLALLEGAELVAWKRIELAAKNFPSPPESLPIPDPEYSSLPSNTEPESTKQ